MFLRVPVLLALGWLPRAAFSTVSIAIPNLLEVKSEELGESHKTDFIVYGVLVPNTQDRNKAMYLPGISGNGEKRKSLRPYNTALLDFYGMHRRQWVDLADISTNF